MRPLWAVVLAGGDGRRVAALTGDSRGWTVPKQYYSFGGRTSMLRWALDRAFACAPPERVVVVVAEPHREFWESELSEVPPENILAQHFNRGTAPGLLLPVLNILSRDPEAGVVILPSDHHIDDEAIFAGCLHEACSGIEARGTGVVLLGIRPSHPEAEMGWILPARRAVRGLRRVVGFVEKPGIEGARRLMRTGALVNAFVLVAAAQALVRLYAATLPWLMKEFARCPEAVVDPASRRALYERLPAADFSREVLERAPRSLLVLAVPDCGWCDLGTPDELLRFLGRAQARRSWAHA